MMEAIEADRWALCGILGIFALVHAVVSEEEHVCLSAIALAILALAAKP